MYCCIVVSVLYMFEYISLCIGYVLVIAIVNQFVSSSCHLLSQIRARAAVRSAKKPGPWSIGVANSVYNRLKSLHQLLS